VIVVRYEFCLSFEKGGMVMLTFNSEKLRNCCHLFSHAELIFENNVLSLADPLVVQKAQQNVSVGEVIKQHFFVHRFSISSPNETS